MEFAHSLGYPHYNHMLDDMSLAEYMDMHRFFAQRAEQKEDARHRAEEANLRSWFNRKHVAQSGVKDAKK